MEQLTPTQEALAAALESIEAITNEENFIRSADSKLYEIRSIASRALSQHVLGAQPLPAQPVPAAGDMEKTFAGNALSWAVDRWNAEVANRPLVNRNRRPLDDAWRQVMRYFGGDPEALVGKAHDELLATPPAPSEPAQQAARLYNAVTWALGANGAFTPQGTMDGKYWWRGELAERAGLEWDGQQYQPAPQAVGERLPLTDEQIKAAYQQYGTGRLDGFEAAVRSLFAAHIKALKEPT